MNKSAFILDPRIANDTFFLLDAPLCRVGLMDDARFPWLILVPCVPLVREWPDLSSIQQVQLQVEINAAARALQQAFPSGEKLNIAALGNVVPQLHIHVVLRHIDDAAWPKPVWGVGEREPYSKETALHTSSAIMAFWDLSDD